MIPGKVLVAQSKRRDGVDATVAQAERQQHVEGDHTNGIGKVVDSDKMRNGEWNVKERRGREMGGPQRDMEWPWEHLELPSASAYRIPFA